MTQPTATAADSPKRGLSEGAQLYVLFGLCVACALALCVVPRMLAPNELPALRLPRAPVLAAIAADEQARKAAPRTPAAFELERLYLEDGQAEDRSTESVQQRGHRRRQLHETYQQLVHEQGQAAALAMRARAVEKLEAALELRLPEEQVTSVMGVYAYALQNYQATRGGDEVAPHFVLRTLYKARWNLMMGLSPDFAFGPIELRAYHGWLALHADNLGYPTRIKALDSYAAAGGPHAIEAHAELLFLAKQYDLAVSPLQVAYAKTGNLRLRNYLAGARFMAEQTAEPAPSQGTESPK